MADGEVAVVTLAAGVGSRWTTGAGVVKAVNPFAQLAGSHRSFLEIHLAKTRQAPATPWASPIPHVVTTSYLTHAAIEHHLRATGNYGHDGPVYLSRGRSIGQRLIPMTRDLTFLWEETSHETLDENKQKVREAGRRAILDWARGQREGSDYTDNVPIQRFNPPGHFYEVPNLLRNGVLARLLDDYPRLNWLLVHNIDTLGATLEPGILGSVIESGATLSFEVIPRRIDDRGGGLAKVGGRLRLLEGLAQPREDTEFKLRYYNTLTTWVRIDGLLDAFGLARDDLRRDPEKVAAAVRGMAARVPTYVTIKDVKRRWGHGQEDVYPVAQFEKLWGDLSSLPDLHMRVPGRRPPPRAAAQGRRPARRLGQRRQHGLRRSRSAGSPTDCSCYLLLTSGARKKRLFRLAQDRQPGPKWARMRRSDRSNDAPRPGRQWVVHILDGGGPTMRMYFFDVTAEGRAPGRPGEDGGLQGGPGLQ